MASTTVRIGQAARSALRLLSEQTGAPMSVVLDRAIECYRRRCILEEANSAFAALRADPIAWQEELEERRAWDVTLADGLGDDEGDAP